MAFLWEDSNLKRKQVLDTQIGGGNIGLSGTTPLLKSATHQTSYKLLIDETFLIEQVIALIREIGKFPTVGELRLKAHGSSFPSHDTIRRRLGGQSELSNKLIVYCEGKPEYSDITEICREVTTTLKEESEHQSKESNIEFSYVYLMKSGRFYKVGSSRNVKRRDYELGIKFPEDLKTLHKIRTDDPIGIENYWHNRFKDKRKRGEWFDLSNEDISAFKRKKFM